MNIKAVILLETVKNGRTYSFSVENGSPFNEALEAAAEIISQIDSMAKENQKAQEQTTQPDSKTSDQTVENPN